MIIHVITLYSLAITITSSELGRAGSSKDFKRFWQDKQLKFSMVTASAHGSPPNPLRLGNLPLTSLKMLDQLPGLQVRVSMHMCCICGYFQPSQVSNNNSERFSVCKPFVTHVYLFWHCNSSLFSQLNGKWLKVDSNKSFTNNLSYLMHLLAQQNAPSAKFPAVVHNCSFFPIISSPLPTYLPKASTMHSTQLLTLEWLVCGG